MNPSQRFTLLEASVSIVVLILLVALLLPACTDNRRHARIPSGNTHIRGIHSGMVLYAQGNKDFYPGLDSTGAKATASIAAGPGTHGTDSTNGYDVTYRMAVLLRGNYLSPEYMLSPAESNAYKSTIATGQSLNPNHFSYAMLRINEENSGRRSEWKATNHSRAAAISDRNIGPDADKKAMSIHTSESDGWRGSVAYNDNHAVFETSPIIKTGYDTHTAAHDNLFADDKDDNGKSGNDAAMVYQDESTYVNQK